jgi:hypothetical protein
MGINREQKFTIFMCYKTLMARLKLVSDWGAAIGEEPAIHGRHGHSTCATDLPDLHLFYQVAPVSRQNFRLHRPCFRAATADGMY